MLRRLEDIPEKDRLPPVKVDEQSEKISVNTPPLNESFQRSKRKKLMSLNELRYAFTYHKALQNPHDSAHHVLPMSVLLKTVCVF